MFCCYSIPLGLNLTELGNTVNFKKKLKEKEKDKKTTAM